MNSLVWIVAACLGLATAGPWTEEMRVALSAYNELQEVTEEEAGVEGAHSGCRCSPVSCECWGIEGDVMVNVSLLVDELHPESGHVHVVGKFSVGDVQFEQIWCVNKMENFCKFYKGKLYCFKVQIDDKGGNHLNGCIRMSKPHPLPIGCFKLPL